MTAAVPSAKLLGDQLQHDPVRHANNAVKLLNFLQEPLQEPLARAAIQALKLFYVAQHDEGKLQSSNAKRQRVDPAAAAAAAGSSEQDRQQQQQQEATPEELYAAWLSRQYSAFVSRLLHLLCNAPSASLQVAAMSAVMECVRHEAGPATFSNKLFTQMLMLIMTSDNVRPEVFSLLFSKYLPCLDVRYYTLAAVNKLAQQHAVRSAAAAPTAAGAADSDADEEPQQQQQQQQQQDGQSRTAGESGAQQQQPQQQQQQQQQQQPEFRASADVSRTMFDVLSHVVPLVPPQQDKQQQGSKQQQQQPPQQPELELQSWCGATEAGLVKAAVDAAASAKIRRKRKQQEQQAAEAGAAPAATAAAAWANLKVQQRAYGDAWLALLRTDLPQDIYRKVLLKLHSDVLPAMLNPLLLSDFLSHAVDRGGFEGMLALNGLFRLVTRHGLEYPAFYARLYALITPAAFLHKHRVQFFQLADIFLASGMVPAYTAAAFTKKMARLALHGPPAAAMLAIGFIHNIIRRHPACMVMLHKPQPAALDAAIPAGHGDAGNGAVASAAAAAAAAGAGVDVYDEQEADPAKSRAVESSLWELEALRNHYCPQVANMCSVLDKDLSDRVRTSELDIQPLLPASYASLMAQELGGKLRKGVAVAFYKTQPHGLWDTGLVGDDLQGWDLAAPAPQKEHEKVMQPLADGQK